MCFVHYHNWVVCTVYNLALMLFFILRKFWWERRHSPCTPGTYTAVPLVCQQAYPKKLLDHFRVIINIPFVTPAVIFLINNRNFHSDVCNGNGSCSFLHAPHPAGGDVFEQQPPNNHSVHVHVPIPCIDLTFICIICPLGLNRYCSIAVSFCLSQMSKLLSFAFPPIEAACSSFFCLFTASVARALLILNEFMIRMNSLCMTFDSLFP